MQHESTHCGFADESHWNKGRYRTIGLVTMPTSRVAETSQAVQATARGARIREIKWKSVSSDRHRRTTEALFDLFVAPDSRRDIRIDVVIWDTHDSRHDIKGRDDSANLGRMYYQLMRNVIERRWPDASSWSMSVDERTDMDWGMLTDCLAGRSRKAKTAYEPILFSSSRTGSGRWIHLTEVSSTEYPLVQVADLFAGLAAFSWNRSAEHRSWKQFQREMSAGQRDMFAHLGGTSIANNAKPKHQVLERLMSLRPRGVAMRSEMDEGLRTYGPSNRINFWPYEPQRVADKAPQRLIA